MLKRTEQTTASPCSSKFAKAPAPRPGSPQSQPLLSDNGSHPNTNNYTKYQCDPCACVSVKAGIQCEKSFLFYSRCLTFIWSTVTSPVWQLLLRLERYQASTSRERARTEGGRRSRADRTVKTKTTSLFIYLLLHILHILHIQKKVQNDISYIFHNTNMGV